jgi:hypothetical protein
MTFEDEESSNLTVEQCEEMAVAISQDAAQLPSGPRRNELLKLAQYYRVLAAMKSTIARKLN